MVLALRRRDLVILVRLDLLVGQLPARIIVIRRILVVVGFFFLLGLGVWQSQRFAWKTDLLDQIKQAAEAPVEAIGLPVVVKEWSHVKVKLHAIQKPFLVYHQGRYQVVVAGRTSQGQWVLSDLGEVASESVAIPLPSQLTVEGVIRTPHKSAFTPPNNLDHRQWYFIDPVEMGRVLDVPLAPYYIKATIGTIDTVQAHSLSEMVSAIPNDHLQYAITWFSLSAIYGIFVYVYRHKKQGKKK